MVFPGRLHLLSEIRSLKLQCFPPTVRRRRETQLQIKLAVKSAQILGAGGVLKMQEKGSPIKKNASEFVCVCQVAEEQIQ